MYTTMKKTTALLLALMLLLGICTLAPKTAQAVDAGDFEITLTQGGGVPQLGAGEGKGDYFLDDTDIDKKILYINSDTPMTITINVAQTNDRIRVADNVTANITLKGVNIAVPGGSPAFWLGDGATATITLEGDNTLTGGGSHAGLVVGPTATLTITSATGGKLTATGGGGGVGGGAGGGAGIGGNGSVDSDSGNISITGNANVTAKGGAGAVGSGGGAGIGGGTSAGIGGGGAAGQAGGDAGNIIIYEGANVKADGGDRGDLQSGKGATIGSGGAGNGVSNPDGEVKYTLVRRAEQFTLEFLRRTLTDKPTGVTVSGNGIANISRLVVQENKQHDASTCRTCAEIRRRQAAGEVIALYDITLTHGHSGPVEVFIPFSGNNGASYTVLHCNNGVLEEQSAPYANGGVTTTWRKLSPFAIVRGAQVAVPENVVVDPPKTGENPIAPVGAGLVVCALVAGVLVKRRRILHRACRGD